MKKMDSNAVPCRISRRRILTGGAALLALPFASETVAGPELVPPVSQRDVSLDIRKASPAPLVHFWSKCVGAGRANEGLRAAWLEQLRAVKSECGFEYCRFHGLFHDDMFVLRIQDGKAVYNWQYVDELFDRMLVIGVKPFVELGFMPKDLASTERTQFWWKGNVSPPKDYALWGNLVSRFAQHCVERYGLQEVRTWYFEVWNEPNLRGFWDGTRSQYFELYRISVLAIKSIDPTLRVGGPATSNFVGDGRFEGDIEDKSKQLTNTVGDLNTLPWKGVWIEAFLAYCAQHGLPVDFVSTHPYPTDFALNPGTGKSAGKTRELDATRKDLTWLRQTVGKSAYPNAEIHLTEWSSSPSSRDHTHDYQQAAAYIIKANLDSAGLVDSLSYWTFSDIFEEAGAGELPFHGGFGLMNYQGIPKPSFHGYRMLNALGDTVLRKEDGLVVTRHSKTGKLTALAYHFPANVHDSLSFGDVQQAELMLRQGAARDFRLLLEGVKPGALFTVERLDHEHGNAIKAWQDMGSPADLSRSQIKNLTARARATRRREMRAGPSGSLSWLEELSPWACVLINQV
jgi:xylan 1,4-beta-xylosidase